LTENREWYLRKQEAGIEENEVEIDKFNLDIKLVQMTIKSLKSNTSSGVGGAPAELLKSGTERLYELLRQIFERCLNGDEIPSDWKIGHISKKKKKRKER
jgi:hypothetical protein